MKFYEVQPYLESGKKIRRRSFTNSDLYLYFENDTIYIHHSINIQRGRTSVNSEDLLADDWEIIEEKNEIILEANVIESTNGILLMRLLKPLPIDEKTIKIRAVLDNNLLSFKESMLYKHKKFLEEWKDEIEEIMMREEGTNCLKHSIKYQDLYSWSIKRGVLDECLEHIKELEDGSTPKE